MTGPLDKQGFIPLYHQILQSLLDRIHSGELKEGDMLESEEELSRKHQVSRMTARQALNVLKARGYAVSERGRGTFVVKPKLDKSILVLDSFTDELRKQGVTPSSKLLEQVVTIPDSEVAYQLRLQPKEMILHLRRVRYANDVALAIEESHIPLKRFPGIEAIDFSASSLYETMKNKYEVKFGWADESLQALNATTEEANLLSIAKNASLLYISRTLVDADGVPVEFAISRYRGDRYRASVRVPFTSQE